MFLLQNLFFHFNKQINRRNNKRQHFCFVVALTTFKIIEIFIVIVKIFHLFIIIKLLSEIFLILFFYLSTILTIKKDEDILSVKMFYFLKLFQKRIDVILSVFNVTSLNILIHNFFSYVFMEFTIFFENLICRGLKHWIIFLIFF